MPRAFAFKEDSDAVRRTGARLNPRIGCMGAELRRAWFVAFITISLLWLSGCLGDAGTPVNTPGPSPRVETPQHRPVDWQLVIRAEQSWLELLSPTEGRTRPEPVPMPPNRYYQVFQTVQAFEDVNSRLKRHATRLSPESEAESRAKFRIALYAEIRTRFQHYFVFSEAFSGLTNVRGVSPETLHDEAQRQDRLAQQYSDFRTLYAEVSETSTFPTARWGAAPLATAIAIANSQDDFCDPDSPDNRNLLCAAASAEYRNNLISLLRMDPEAP
jgi:hypothetical protein